MPSVSLWKQLVPNWPIISMVSIAFLLGKWGFSFFLLPIILYFMLGIERRWRERAVARELKQVLAEEDVRSVLLKSSAESAQWLNRTMKVIWPHLDRWMSTTTTSFLMRALLGVNQPDEYGKPKSVKFDVKYVSFGNAPIQFDGITAKQPTAPYTNRIDLHFTFRGDIIVELEAAIAFMKIPLSLTDIDMRGVLKVEMSFKDRGAIKQLSIGFLGPPTLNFSIKTMGKIDIMDLPSLKDSIDSLLVGYLRASMTFPNALQFDWSGPAASSSAPLSDEERTKIQRAFAHQTVSALDDGNEAQQTASLDSPTVTPSTSSIPAQTTPITTQNAKDTISSATHPLTPTIPKLAASTSSISPKAASSVAGTTPTKPTRGNGSLPMASKPIFTKKEEDVNEFLLMSPEEFTGTLQVRVVECQKLATSDIFTVSPYVVLEANGVTYQTTVVKRTTDPFWTNALFEFPVPKFLPPKGLILKVHVFDKNKVGSDESLGHVQFNLNPCFSQPDELRHLRANLVGAPSGLIALQCKYIPE